MVAKKIYCRSRYHASADRSGVSRNEKHGYGKTSFFFPIKDSTLKRNDHPAIFMEPGHCPAAPDKIPPHKILSNLPISHSVFWMSVKHIAAFIIPE